MSVKDDFIRQFQQVLEEAPLPARILSRWQPESCLSHREDGEVWLLRDAEEKRFILKTDRAGRRDLAGEFELLRRFTPELAGKVPEAADYFEEGGVRYLIRTWLPGQSLSQIQEKEGVFSPERCVHAGEALCLLLERIHGMEPPVIHRDIKPENIILSPSGQPCLIDFDIAREYKAGQGADTVFMGTRRTAAPEQYGYAQTDERTDLYALGVTLRYMLTGSYEPEALEQVDCPKRLKCCLQKATAFSPDDRYRSAKEFRLALTGAENTGKLRWLLPVFVCAAAVILGVFIGRNGRTGGQEAPVSVEAGTDGQGRDTSDALQTPVDGQDVSDSVQPGADEAVNFDNALLEQAVRAELGMPEGVITEGDLARVERLALVGFTLLDREQDYRYTIFSYVDEAPQEGEPFGDISDLSLLAEMPNLKELYLCGQQIEDLTPLKGLPIRRLYLCDNNITDLAPLADIITLQILYIGNNPAKDLSPLASLHNLKELLLDSGEWDDPVDSFAPLGEISQLEWLSLNNRIPADGDWTPLEKLDSLRELKLWHPPADKLVCLGGMDSLTSLAVGEFECEEPVAIYAPQITYFGMLGGLEDLEILKGLTNLEHLDLVGLENVSLEPLLELTLLRLLSVNACSGLDYSVLARMPSLEEVHAWDRQALEEIEATCPDRNFELVAQGSAR